MALGSEGGDEQNNTEFLTSSLSLHVLPLQPIPFELVEEILIRLPVKLLLQLRCACKSWNSLISDRQFAKKHLILSTTHSLHCISYSHKCILESYPLDSVFTNVTTTDLRQLEFSVYQSVYFFGSCNGILCFAAEDHAYSNIIVQLWNPSIKKKLKELPPLGEPRPYRYIARMYGFGYDPVSDNYKVVAVFRELVDFRTSSSNRIGYKDIVTHVKVHNLGTNSWKSIPMFPYVAVPVQQSGQCVSGTMNWLASKDTKKSQCFILSLDLGNESYKEVLLPNYGEVDACTLHLSVLRDFLIMFSGDDVWVMKEYGNKESWTKLFTISYMPSFIKAIYIFEDEHVLLKCREDWKHSYMFYNCRDGTSKLIGYANRFIVKVRRAKESLKVHVKPGCNVASIPVALWFRQQNRHVMTQIAVADLYLSP